MFFLFYDSNPVNGYTGVNSEITRVPLLPLELEAPPTPA